MPDSSPAAAPNEAYFRLPPLPPLSSGLGFDVQSRFVLREILFAGNTVFTDEQLTALARPYIGRTVSMTDLEDLRLALTRHYQEAGYANSGALLPAQHIQEGRVNYRIVEGRLTELRISGTEGLRPEYVRGRLLEGITDKPLNTEILGERFQLLLTDPLIRRLNGSLRPGERPGESILELAVTRAKAYEMALVFDNQRPPGTGSMAMRLLGGLRNTTGWGDLFHLNLSLSEGSLEGDSSFTIPVNSRDTRLRLRYAAGRSSIVEEPLDSAGIESRTRTWEIGLEHPLRHSREENLAAGATLSLRSSRTELFGAGVQLSPGVEPDGSSHVSVLRLNQDYSFRGARNAFAARSTFNFGLDAFDATINGDQPDGRFISWIGQLRFARRFGENGSQLILRGDLQLSDGQLLSLEQFAVGGAGSVRGYRENQLVRDEGYVLSAEYRHPFQLEDNSDHALELAFFVDTGGARYRDGNDRIKQLSSAGMGLRWRWRRYNAMLQWAHGFEPVPAVSDRDIQDEGIHFRLQVDLL